MVSKGDTLKMMKEKNPKEFSRLKNAAINKKVPNKKQMIQEQGFIDMPSNEEVA